MKRTGAILLTVLLLSGMALAQEGPRNIEGNAALDKNQAQLAKSIAALYLADLKRDAELSDEQFIAAQPVVLNFIQQRFRNANQRKNLDERQELLHNQSDASAADLQQVNEQLTKVDNESATWETRFLRRVQDVLSSRGLSPRQVALFRSFNRKFFNDRLPTLMEQARNTDRPAAGARANQNRNQGVQPRQGAGNALRGKSDAGSARPKLIR